MRTKIKRPPGARDARSRKRCRPKRALAASAKDRQLRHAILAEGRPGLERDTRLMPWLIAETVSDEVSRFLDVELPNRYAATSFHGGAAGRLASNSAKSRFS